jgi:hypothetical protein
MEVLWVVPNEKAALLSFVKAQGSKPTTWLKPSCRLVLALLLPVLNCRNSIGWKQRPHITFCKSKRYRTRYGPPRSVRTVDGFTPPQTHGPARPCAACGPGSIVSGEISRRPYGPSLPLRCVCVCCRQLVAVLLYRRVAVTPPLRCSPLLEKGTLSCYHHSGSCSFSFSFSTLAHCLPRLHPASPPTHQ